MYAAYELCRYHSNCDLQHLSTSPLSQAVSSPRSQNEKEEVVEWITQSNGSPDVNIELHPVTGVPSADALATVTDCA